MVRTTVMLPEEVASRLRYESRRRGISVASIVREAVEDHLPPTDPGTPLSFFAVGEGGPPDASERVDEHVGAAIRGRRERRD